MPVIEEFHLYASHHQFYVQDSEPIGSMGDPSFWSPQAMDAHLATAEGILGIGTGSYDDVKVRIEHLPEAPPLDLAAWDHVVEGDLNLRTRVLLVYGCIAASGLFFFVKPGHYRV